MTKLYIDCEFNGGFGGLISMALVAEDGREFYEVLPCDKPVRWVAANVMPILGKEAISPSAFANWLAKFLGSFERIELIADHPADLAYFFNAIIMDDVGTWARIPPLTATIVPGVKYVSAIPHNALEDARGIMRTLSESPSQDSLSK